MDNYIINLINSINATCNNARNALNVLLAITVYLGVLILNVNDEALFRDSAKLLPQIGMELKLSTSFIVAPLLYIFIIYFYYYTFNIITQITTLINKYL